MINKIKKWIEYRKKCKLLHKQERLNPALKAAWDKARQGIPVNAEELALILKNHV